MEHIWDNNFITEKLKCALLDILHEIPSDSDLLDPSAAPSVVASLFKKQSTALLTTFRSKEVAEADPAVTIKVILIRFGICLALAEYFGYYDMDFCDNF